MIASRIFAIALATTALAFAAAPADAYHVIKFKNVQITSYSFSGSAANDLPDPPKQLATPHAAPKTISKSMDMASPKLAQSALNGSAPSAQSPARFRKRIDRATPLIAK